jgi:SRF-type transcription factor (DNA-binding and dimerisation domain)
MDQNDTPKKTGNDQRNFLRRKKTLFKKANKLQRLHRAEVFLVIKKQDQFYSYTTLNDTLKPPTVEQNVSIQLFV